MDRREFLIETVVGLGALASGGLNIAPVKSDNVFKVTALMVDHPNSNGRIYTKNVIEKVIAKFNRGSTLGELWTGDKRADMMVRFANASHEVKDIYLEGDYLKADVLPLLTPQGKILKSLLDSNAAISFRPFGIGDGEVEEINGKSIFVIKTYNLVGIDAMPTDKAASF